MLRCFACQERDWRLEAWRKDENADLAGLHVLVHENADYDGSEVSHGQDLRGPFDSER